MHVLVVVAHGGEQLGKVVVVQDVAHVAAVAAGTHEPQRAQQPQVMRGRAEAQLRGGGELLDRTLAGEQLGEDAQATGRGERLERLGELLGLIDAERPQGGWRARKDAASMDKSTHMSNRSREAVVRFASSSRGNSMYDTTCGRETP